MDVDRLSALPDRALNHVLSFLDAGDASRVIIITRRSRTLRRQTDAVVLDTESYGWCGYDGERVGWLLFGDAMADVLAGGRCPVRELSVFVSSFYQPDFCARVMRASPGMEALLAAPAMQRLEDLRVELEAEFGSTCGAYELPASRLPCCRSLRSLDLTGCTLGPPGAAAFGCLETLRLESCESSLENLQAMLDAAPSLAALHLEHVVFISDELGHGWHAVMLRQSYRVRCPAAVVDVALLHCHSTDGLYLDAPNVRSLRYEGFLKHFPFSSRQLPAPVPNPRHVELSFCDGGRCVNRSSMEEVQFHAFFWESIGSFC
ncbi:hypothetical protein ACP70R_009412 [Stipagrostis hirtigluma subsp. patula]